MNIKTYMVQINYGGTSIKYNRWVIGLIDVRDYLLRSEGTISSIDERYYNKLTII